MAIASALVWFSVAIVFVSDPVTLTIFVPSYAVYSDKDAPGGIPWNSAFSELDVIILNPASHNYSDVDLLVRPDVPVAEIGQLSKLSGVSFEPIWHIMGGVKIEVGGLYKSQLSPLASDAGYMVHCDRIPPEASLRIIMALVNAKKTKGSVSSRRVFITNEEAEEFVKEPEKHISIPFDILSEGHHYTYWIGAPNNTDIYRSGAKAKFVLVKGSYTASGRVRHVNTNLAVRW